MNIKEFIEKNIDLIDDQQWDKVYKLLFTSGIRPHSKFTNFLLKIGINPLNDINYIPNLYLDEADITSFNIPFHIKIIQHRAFSMSKLESIYIPEGVEVIESGVFCDCRELKSICFPYSLKSIGQEAFRNCHSLKQISYNGTKEDWSKIELSITSFSTTVGDYKAVKCSDGFVTLRTS